VVVVRGNIKDAYAPACVREGCQSRTVEQALRTLVYLRPNVLLVQDRVQVGEASDRVTWNAHVESKPDLARHLAQAETANSQVTVQTLLPLDVQLQAHRAPTPSKDGPHTQYRVWEEKWRIEAAPARSRKSLVFLHWVSVAKRGEPAQKAHSLPDQAGVYGFAGEELLGVVFALEGTTSLDVVIPKQVKRIVVVGLEPGRRYQAGGLTAADCRLLLKSDPKGAMRANAGGFAVLSGCSGNER
jgi:hypothetical protein